MKNSPTLICRTLLCSLFLFAFASTSFSQTLDVFHTMSSASSGVKSIEFSHSGQELLTGDASGALQLWNPSEGKLMRSFQTKISNFRVAAWSPDDSIFIGAGCTNGEYSQDEIQIWARNKGTWLRTLSTSKKPNQSTIVNCAAFSPNGKILASGMSVQEGNQEADPSHGVIVLWDTNTGKPSKILNEANDVRQIAFSPDGKNLICGTLGVVSYDKDDRANLRSVLSVWEVGSGKRLRSLGRSDAVIGDLSVSPSGNSVAVGYYLLGKNPELPTGEIAIWNSQTGQFTGHIAGLNSGIDTVNFSPDNKWIFAANDLTKFGESVGSEIKVFNASTLKIAFQQQTSESIRALAISPTDSMIATGGFPMLKTQAGGKLESFNLDQFKGVMKVWNFRDSS